MRLRESISAARRGDPIQNAAGEMEFEFQFGADDPTFAGHFPGRPILPGVFQLELTRVAAESVLKCSLSIREIRKAKFQRPILPEETVRLALKLSEHGGTIQARAGFSVGGEPAGETVLVLWRSN